MFFATSHIIGLNYSNIHQPFIYSFIRRMDKQNVLYPGNGILCSNKNKKYVYGNLDESQKHYFKQKQ